MRSKTYYFVTAFLLVCLVGLGLHASSQDAYAVITFWLVLFDGEEMVEGLGDDTIELTVNFKTIGGDPDERVFWMLEQVGRPGRYARTVDPTLWENFGELVDWELRIDGEPFIIPVDPDTNPVLGLPINVPQLDWEVEDNR